MNVSEKNNKTNSVKGPIDAIKDMQIKKQEEILALLEEKQALTVEGMIPYKKFNFFQKYIFKRKEYAEYIRSQEVSMQKKVENKTRLDEIEQILVAEGFPTRSSILQKIQDFSRATNLEMLGFSDSNKAIEMLVTEGIHFQFESYEQAFKIAPDFLGKNVEFMKRAIKENIEFIQYDQTNNEELYKEVISIRINDLQAKKEKEDVFIADKIDIDAELEELEALMQELKSPKQVREGKYKVPHKFMFEEIRNNIATNQHAYWYRSVDGIYDKEFAEELVDLYENPDILVGVHGLKQNEEVENEIFVNGLRNSMQNADVALNRTVAFGENLTFTKLLNYRIPYNGVETEAAIILTLPRKVLDEKSPVPIWGSNEIGGSDNHILPQYIYGVYHSKSEGESRKIIRNDHKNPAKYKYLKYDFNSSKRGSHEMNEKGENIEV